jgi:hypothetical protein
MARRGDRPRSVVVARGVDAESAAVVDFDFTASILLEERLPTISGLQTGETLDFDSSLHFDRGSSANLSSLYSSNRLLFLPDDAMEGNDTHSIGVSATSGDSGNQLPALGRYVSRYQRDVTDLDFTLPPTRTVGITVLDEQTVRLEASFENTEFDWVEVWTEQIKNDGPDPGFGFRSVGATISRDWFDGETAYEFPDLTALPGWDAFWDLRSEVRSHWSFSYFSSNRGLEGRLVRYVNPPSADLDGLEVKATRLSGVMDP